MCPQSFREYVLKRAGEEDAHRTCSAASVQEDLHHGEVPRRGVTIDSADLLLHRRARRRRHHPRGLADSLQTKAAVTSLFQEHAMYVGNGDTERTIVPQEEVEASAVAGEDEVVLRINDLPF